MIKELRKKYKNALLLDSGDFISKEVNVPDLRAATSVEGAKLMKYDALNVADGELTFGIEFLKNNFQKTNVPLLSANLTTKNDNHFVGQEFLIKKLDGLKVGIIGLVSPEYFDKETLTKGELVIKNPEETLKKVLSEIQGKANVIVLLSHLGYEATRELVQKVNGIDVAIVGHGLQTNNIPELVGKTLVVQNSYKGRYLGTLSLTIDKNGSISDYQGSAVELSKTIPDDPEVAAL
ncbi:MAG: hypothetical protein V2A69_12965, partial [Pseudomonadota bacterium]